MGGRFVELTSLMLGKLKLTISVDAVPDNGFTATGLGVFDLATAFTWSRKAQ